MDLHFMALCSARSGRVELFRVVNFFRKLYILKVNMGPALIPVLLTVGLSLLPQGIDAASSPGNI